MKVELKSSPIEVIQFIDEQNKTIADQRIEIDWLRKIIEGAPHEDTCELSRCAVDGCGLHVTNQLHYQSRIAMPTIYPSAHPFVSKPCNCFKAALDPAPSTERKEKTE